MVYADEILKKKDDAQGPNMSDRTIGTITGAFIGLAGGFAWAWYKNKKYLPWMLGGTAAGGLIMGISLIKK